jgi:hypothetical protein
MKETKRFLNSEFYNLEDVHALNSFLKELPKPNLPKEKIEEVINLLSCTKSFHNLDDYVKNSKMYNKIITQNNLYIDAQLKLKNLNYTKEIILDDTIANLDCLTKHSITYNSIYYDEFDYNLDFNDEPQEIEVTNFFYTKSYCNYIPINPVDYIMPYIRKTIYGSVDLIHEHLLNYHYISNSLKAYTFCNENNYDINIFKKVFDINNLIYYMDNFIQDKISKTFFYNSDITNLIQNAILAFNKKYIFEDKYVDYPNTNYLNFLENYIGKTYFHIPDSQ